MILASQLLAMLPMATSTKISLTTRIRMFKTPRSHYELHVKFESSLINFLKKEMPRVPLPSIRVSGVALYFAYDV
jgi:hypothetical protein